MSLSFSRAFKNRFGAYNRLLESTVPVKAECILGLLDAAHSFPQNEKLVLYDELVEAVSEQLDAMDPCGLLEECFRSAGPSCYVPPIRQTKSEDTLAVKMPQANEELALRWLQAMDDLPNAYISFDVHLLEPGEVGLTCKTKDWLDVLEKFM